MQLAASKPCLAAACPARAHLASRSSGVRNIQKLGMADPAQFKALQQACQTATLPNIDTESAADVSGWCFSPNPSGEIAAMHADDAIRLVEIKAWAAHAAKLPSPVRLVGAWAQGALCLATTTAIPTSSTSTADAEDVAPRLSPAAVPTRVQPEQQPRPGPYQPPAKRLGASAAMVAGCRMPLAAAAAPTATIPTPVGSCPPADCAATRPYKLPQLRTAEEQTAAALLPRPGRPCPWPRLTQGPLLAHEYNTAVWSAAHDPIYLKAALKALRASPAGQACC